MWPLTLRVLAARLTLHGSELSNPVEKVGFQRPSLYHPQVQTILCSADRRSGAQRLQVCGQNPGSAAAP
jgi:hypothetical protein